MKSEKLFRFGIIVATLIVMNLFRGWFIFNVIMSVFASLMGDGTLTYTMASITTTIVIGVCTTLPLYWGLRDNAEEKRRFLTHFSDHEYNRANLRSYLKETKIVKQDTIVFLIAILVVLVFRYTKYILYSPYYIIDFVLEFVIIFGIYLLFNRFVRRRLYDKWESERMYKGK